MIENSKNPEVVSETTPEVLNFQEGVKKAKNFVELYTFFGTLSDGFVGDNGRKYSATDLVALICEECDRFDRDWDMNGSISRLKKVSGILAQQFPRLMDRWKQDHDEIELDA